MEIYSQYNSLLKFQQKMQCNHPKTHYHTPNFDANVENNVGILKNLGIGLS